jgi:hypothetical protein
MHTGAAASCSRGQFMENTVVCPFIDNIDFYEKLFKFELVVTKFRYE